MRPTASELARALGLEPHPEGGYFLETYRAPGTQRTARGERPASTAILFLVTADAISRLHRLASDELWLFQGGLPLEIASIAPDGELTVRVLGDATVAAAELGEAAGPPRPEPQVLVPVGHWQGARLAGGPHLPAERAWTLVSCVVTPGFDYADFELGERSALLAAYPALAEVVAAFT